MSDQVEREAIASLLMEHVKNDDITKVETWFRQFSQDSQWREIVRCEFPIPDLIEGVLMFDVVVPRLLSYEITTLSPFHYAAFRGHSDIVINFVDHDIPVDITLSSGTTALHLASFAGKVDCVKLLVEVYKAYCDSQDKYGWSALHYASTEGHTEVAEILMNAGCNVGLRDKDGTTAAFRAQVNGFEELATLLCDEDDDDMLCIDPEFEGKPPIDNVEDLYSKINRSRATSEKTLTRTSSETGTEASNSILRDKSNMSKNANFRRAQSEVPRSAPTQVTSAATLPRNFKENRTSTIRRMIRQELQAAMLNESEDPGYMTAQDYSTKEASNNDDDKFAFAGIGPGTLTGIMREEISKATKELFSKHAKSGSNDSTPVSSDRDSMLDPDYEDIYETVKHINQAAEVDDPDAPNEAPPLPPRNDGPASPFRSLTIIEETKPRTSKTLPAGAYMLQKPGFEQESESMVLKESIKRLAPILGPDWKKLAYRLPIDKTPLKVKDRVSGIEKRHPNDNEKQAALALAEWRIYRGQAADVDDLVVALRKCGLHSLINEVERVTQEFTA